MRFSILTTALVALTGSVTALLTADDIVTSISTLTAKSQSLIQPAGTLSLTNAALLLLGEGPWAQVVIGLNDLTKTTKNQIVYLQTAETNPVKFTGEEAQLIGDTLRGLVNVLTQLVDELVKQLDVVKQLPVLGQVLSPVLELLKSLVDNLLKEVVNLVEDTLASDLNLDIVDLNNVLSQASIVF